MKVSSEAQWELLYRKEMSVGRNALMGEQARSFIASGRRKQKKDKKKSTFGQSHQGGK